MGSEADWARWVTPTVGGAPAVAEGNATNALKYLVYPSPRPSMTLRDLRYDSATFREINKQAGIYDAANFAPAPPPGRYKDDIRWLGSFRSGYEQTCGWHDGRWTCTPARKPS